MKNFRPLQLALGFGLISSFSFGQTTEKKEIKTSPSSVTAPAPVPTEKKIAHKKEEIIQQQQVNPVEKNKEAEIMVEETEKPLELKPTPKVKPVEIPVTIPVKPKPPIK